MKNIIKKKVLQDYYIPPVVTIVIISAIYYFSSVHRDYFLINRFFIDDYILSMVQILATIFAITISLTLLGFQYFSESLTPSILKSFIKRPFILILIGTYSLFISTLMILLLFPNIIRFLDHAYGELFYLTILFLFLFCLSLLVSYIFYMVKIFQPSNTIEELSNKIKPNFYRKIVENYKQIITDDKLVEIEQIIIKSIRNNDFHSFRTGIDTIVSKHENFLEAIDEDLGEESLGTIEEDPEELLDAIDEEPNSAELTKEKIIVRIGNLAKVSQYFLIIYDRIFSEILSSNNRIFFEYYCAKFFEIIKAIYDYGDSFSRNRFQYTGRLNDIGFTMLKKEFFSESFFFEYYLMIKEFLEVQYKLIDSDFKKYQLFIDQIDNLVKLSNKASDDANEKIVYYVKLLLTERLRYVLDDIEKISSKKSNPNSSPPLISLLPKYLLYGLKDIHTNAVDKNLNISFFGEITADGSLYGLLGKIRTDELFEDVGAEIIEVYCNGTISSIEKNLSQAKIDLKMQAGVMSNNPRAIFFMYHSLIWYLDILDEDFMRNKKDMKDLVNILELIYQSVPSIREAVKDFKCYHHLQFMLFDEQINMAIEKYKPRLQQYL